ncbi:hypothetical protein QUF73_24910 [Cytobacillus sp. NJ13]|nr:hypothetical protein [Cytobacillus sp. NJ13]
MGKRFKTELSERSGVVGKVCSGCMEWKPLEEYFSKMDGLGGRFSKCKLCKGFKGKQYTKLETVNGVTGKNCSQCNEWKPLEEFNKDRECLGGRKAKCKVCSKGYYKENRDKMLTQQIEYYTENKEKIQEYHKQYYLENVETYRERNSQWIKENKKRFRELTRKSGNKWRKNNPEKVNTLNQKRKAKQKALPHDWTQKEREETLQYFGGCCLTGATESIHFDHVIPLATGHGGTVFENMVPLRADLNLSKRDSNLFLWFEDNKERFDLSQDRFDSLIEYLSDLNGMTPEQYREYVFYCHENKQDLTQIS